VATARRIADSVRRGQRGIATTWARRDGRGDGGPCDQTATRGNEERSVGHDNHLIMPQQPAHPKIYHIVHVDRLASIVADGCLHCDATMVEREGRGTSIGISEIKQRRRNLPIACRPGLHVGDCVPFYFCPRSVMLFLLHRANHPNLTYSGGQGPVIHLESDLHKTVKWAEKKGRRWAFTLSNAGSTYFEDRCNLDQLGEVDWSAVQTNRWSGPGIAESIQEGKQAEFLVESSFSWRLVDRIGVYSQGIVQQVTNVIRDAPHRPMIEIRRDWYY
jgi:hypothetical protein